MFRLVIACLLLIGVLATPTVRAKFPDGKVPPRTPTEKIIAALHDSRMNYEKDVMHTPFKEVITDLSRQYGIKIVVNKRAIGDMAPQLDAAKAESFSATDIEGMTLGSFLKAYLPALSVESVTYLVRTDHIEITSLEAVGQETGSLEFQAAASRDFKGPLQNLARFHLPFICLAVKERPISAVLDDLRRVYGLNIVVSPESKDQLKTPITMQLLNVPADTALELISEQAGLGIVRKGNTFRITSNP